MNIAEQIKKFSKEKRLSQQEVANKLSNEQRAIQLLRNWQKRPDNENFSKDCYLVGY